MNSSTFTSEQAMNAYPSQSMHSRREFLRKAGTGFGALAFAAWQQDASLMAALGQHERIGLPHRPGKAKNVIFLFMEGGPSHIDLFDPKPLLNQLAGQKLPDSFPKPITAMGEVHSPLLACKRQWQQHGQAGLWVSDWLPHIATMADEL